MSSDLSSVVCSAPSKVLLAGGYLVLDRENTGLVFSLDARIHVYVQRAQGRMVDSRASSPIHTQSAATKISVRSPQFVGAEWNYECVALGEDKGVQVNPINRDECKGRNSFVESTLAYVLTYIWSSHPKPSILPGCDINIFADNDFYSAPEHHQHPNGSHNGEKRFRTFSTSLDDTHKTGLGSSAALVTALTAALLSFYAELPGRDDGQAPSTQVCPTARTHNLAQAAHCAAQGKIGSGFDIAAAVYGSCVYRRFSPCVLSQLGDVAKSPGFASRLRACVDDRDGTWDAEVSLHGVKLPPGLSMVLCDVDAGTKTEGMVRRMGKWRAGQPGESVRLFQTLQESNEALAQEIIAAGVTRGPDGIGAAMKQSRNLIRELSRASDVPVEPAELTDLLDACEEMKGVVGCTVVGAGGFDAIALLIKNREETIHHLRELFHRREYGRVLTVEGAKEGVRTENPEEFVECI